jgi:hypothetical protein
MALIPYDFEKVLGMFIIFDISLGKGIYIQFIYPLN